jgi:hypothetical protein
MQFVIYNIKNAYVIYNYLALKITLNLVLKLVLF